MDQRKRLLIVLLSISVVIVVVVVAGLFLFSPAEDDIAQAAVPEIPTEARFFDPIEYLREGNGTVTDPLLFEGTEKATPEDTQDKPPELAAPAKPRPTTEPKPQSAGESAQRLRQALRNTNQRRAAPAPATGVAKEQQKPQAIQKSTSSSTAASSSSVPQYWIQLFSSNRLESTQRAQLELEGHQIEGVISTVQVNDENYYRLRVGPFHSQAEAEKFIVWFKNDQQFANSYVVHAAAR